MSDRAAAIEFYKRQRDRTVVVYLPREGGIYRRSDVVDLVDGTVGKHAISAIGQLENNLKWEIVFNFVDNKELFLDHAQHLVKGRQVSVESLAYVVVLGVCVYCGYRCVYQMATSPVLSPSTTSK